jgi:CTP:molybdopterin cytidylyltransferase MocA
VVRYSSSGEKVSSIETAVVAAVGAHWNGRGNATYHDRDCAMRVNAMQGGRTGPRTVLKPAHPNESAFRII